jgi:hypothetical protein
MARKDLAGLAALGALGMMLSKGKKTEVEEPDQIRARMARDKAKEAAKETPKEALKEVPSRGMPVSSSDALPSYLAKQVSRTGGGKPEITDVYTEDTSSPVFKKNEFNEAYIAMPEKNRKAYQDRQDLINANVNNPGYSAGMKKGGAVKKMASGGMTSSASKRADGIAQKGKTRGKMC